MSRAKYSMRTPILRRLCPYHGGIACACRGCGRRRAVWRGIGSPCAEVAGHAAEGARRSCRLFPPRSAERHYASVLRRLVDAAGRCALRYFDGVLVPSVRPALRVAHVPAPRFILAHVPAGRDATLVAVHGVARVEDLVDGRRLQPGRGAATASRNTRAPCAEINSKRGPINHKCAINHSRRRRRPS